jgi:hypothetical protein
MKNLKLICAVSVLLICTVSANAQETPPVTEPNYNKPKLFASLPENIKVNINSLKELLKASNGEAVASDFGNDASFSISGQVVSTASKYNNTIQSVVIRSSNLNGASLTFTRIINEDGSISYTGRIISFEHGDAYELRQKDGNYEFVKRKFQEIMNE